MSRVLVTGATGFLGSAIVSQLRSAGVAVRTTGRSLRPTIDLPDYRPADLCEASGLGAVVQDVHCVIHAAGLAHRHGGSQSYEPDLFSINAGATEAAARAAAAAGVEHFVFVSSASVYGSNGLDRAAESAICRPADPYGNSKYEAERRLIQLAEETGLRVTILRLTTVYGEGDPGNVARLMYAIDRGRFLWIGRGDNLKSLIHRNDAARACVVAALQQSPGRIAVFNVAPPPCTMRDVVNELAAALGRRVPRLRVPASAARLTLKIAAAISPARGPAATWLRTIEKWLSSDAPEGARFSQAFGFGAQIQLSEGIHREVAWYRGLAADRLAARAA